MKKSLLFLLITLVASPIVFSKSTSEAKEDTSFPLSLVYTPKGLTFSSPGKDFSTSLCGYIQADAMKFANNNQGLASGTDIRRARLYLNGKFNSAWGYNLAYDFSTNTSTSGGGIGGTLLFAKVNYSGWKNMLFSLGQIYPSFSISNTSAPSSLDTLETPLPVSAFSPAPTGYFVGAGYNVWNDFLVMQLALFGPNAQQTVTGRNPVGGTARFVYSPIHTETRMLDFGISSWMQRPDGSNSVTVSTVPEIRSNSNMTTIVNSGAISNVISYGTVGAEMAGIYGPWSAQMEYLQMRLHRGNNNSNLMFSGYTITGSYFLTGESLAYAFPAADFEGNINIINKNLGAWEVLARYSTVNLNDANVSGGKERNATLGLNWYLNQHVKFLVNYVYAMAKPGSNGQHENVNSIAVRMQVAF
ncbi:MAG: Phosphate-selective porin O and P superfamily [uncultured bacterium]|nr:MAG: Phosphate-selective porin O and P superfamily [uncultured bacterium]